MDAIFVGNERKTKMIKSVILINPGMGEEHFTNW